MVGWWVLDECSRPGGPVLNCTGPPLAGSPRGSACCSRGRGSHSCPPTPAPADQCRRPPNQDGKDDAEGEEQDRPGDDVMTALEVDVIGGVTDHLGRRGARGPARVVGEVLQRRPEPAATAPRTGVAGLAPEQLDVDVPA